MPMPGAAAGALWASTDADNAAASVVAMAMALKVVEVFMMELLKLNRVGLRV
jgi:hypothetical protein